MFEGISEIASRVSELQSKLEAPSQPAAKADSSAEPSFAQTLQQQAQPTTQPTTQPAHRFSVGANGATQLPPSPGAASGLGALGGGMAGLGGSMGGLAGLGGGLGVLAGIGGNTDSLSGALSGLGGNTDSLSGTLAGLGGNADSLTGALSGLGGNADSMTGSLSGLGGNTDSLAGSLAGLGGNAGSLGGSLAGLGGNAGSLGGSLAALGGKAAGLAGLGSGAGASGGLQGLVGSVAQQEGVNPALAEAVAKSESGFNPSAVSPAGAQGLMQLMPSTFSAYAGSAGEPSGMPVQGGVTQPFGPTTFANEPPLDWNGQHYAHFHSGIDLAASKGTPIRATLGGTIEIRSDPEGYGNLVVVRHGPWDILYGHTSGQPAGIQTGATVRPGDVIGFVGSTGNSTGPHVHYEIRYQGHITDPGPFLHGQHAGPNPLDPAANAKAGVSYLKDMLSRFGNNVPAALAAYNAGPGAVEKYGGIPPYPETQNYVKKTLQYAHDLGA
jgi:murein DD-endopeptidase MepM/ murein hydrolase activator NlpD